MLSPTPQPIDGASPLSVAEGAPGTGSSNAAAAAAADGDHAHDPAEVRMERIFSAISVGIALIGIGIGWTLFKRRPLMEMPRLLENKYYVDEVYDATIINPIKTGSREGLWKIFDVGVIDGIVNGVGRGMTEIGSLARYLQTGFVRGYAAIILFGALAVIGYFAYSVISLIR